MFRLSFLYLGIFTFCISFFSILNIIFSYYFNSLLNVRSYLICLVISLILAIYLTYFNKKYINEKINFFEKLSLVIMGFFYFPLLSVRLIKKGNIKNINHLSTGKPTSKSTKVHPHFSHLRLL